MAKSMGFYEASISSTKAWLSTAGMEHWIWDFDIHYFPKISREGF